MKTLVLLAAGCAVGVLALNGGNDASAQEGKPKDRVVGKWETNGPGGKVVLEVARDGSLAFTLDNGLVMKGKYRFLGDDVMEVEIDRGRADGQKVTRKLKVKVSADEMVTTDESDRVDRYKRSK